MIAPPPPSFGGGSSNSINQASGLASIERGNGIAAPRPPNFNGHNGTMSAPSNIKRMKTGVKDPSPVILLRNMVDPGKVWTDHQYFVICPVDDLRVSMRQ